MKAITPLLPVIFAFPIGFLVNESSCAKFIWTTVGLLFLLKIGALIRNRQHSIPLPNGSGWVAYLFLWPGMRPESFSHRVKPMESVGRNFVEGFIFLVIGLALQVTLFLFWPSFPTDIRLYLGLVSFLILIHFGISSILFATYRLFGWPVEFLFNSPLKSTSLREFWSQRWNLAFVDLDKRIFLPLFPKQLGKAFAVFGIFFVSGILHEIGISYPANGGWGGPLLYFLLHGFLTLIEPSIPVLKKSMTIKHIWVWAALLGPAPLLFHEPFLQTFIHPYFEFANALIKSIPIKSFMYWIILGSGVGHVLVLAASFQVPGKLNWKAEFSRLGRFNQKIFWTYGGYIVFCVVAFALIDLFNARGLLDKHPSSIAIAAFVALFWSARIVIDFGYFKHDDWPTGDIFVIGHTCLTALFTFLALSHWSLVVWHLL